MARLPRLTVAGFPHHIIQRGNNRQPTFLDSGDYERFLQLLADASVRAKVSIHSYVLMPNHFHLVATPGSPEGISVMMQMLGRRYVQGFNRKYSRSGTLWEGRYRSTVIEGESYLLTCLAYLDLNPVRAGLVARPEDYQWSTYAHYAGLRADKMISPHSLYWTLGNTPFAREAAYVELVGRGLVESREKKVRESTLSGWPMGEADFAEKLAKHTQRRLTPKKAGRPRGHR